MNLLFIDGIYICIMPRRRIHVMNLWTLLMDSIAPTRKSSCYISIGLSLSKKKKKVRKIPFQSNILNRLRKREEEEEEEVMMYRACPLVIMHGYLVICHHNYNVECHYITYKVPYNVHDPTYPLEKSSQNPDLFCSFQVKLLSH